MMPNNDELCQWAVNSAVKFAEIIYMKRHINLADNIFVLNIRIRMIHDTLILDTDAELFLVKTMDDLDFIDSGLSAMLVKLQENSKLIERVEQYYNLAETEQQFCEILLELGRGDGNISAIQYPELRERLAPLTSHSRERQDSLEGLIVDSKQQPMEPVVGRDELQELLSL